MNAPASPQPRRLRRAALVLAAALTAAPHSAGAITISFFQTGYSGGATVTGSFSGVDLNGNGVLSTFDPGGEITAYSMSFSGNASVGPFSHVLLDLAPGGLVYVLGTPLLGDDQAPAIEGLASGTPISASMPLPGFSPISYATGYGPTGMTTGFGTVEDKLLPNPPVDVTSNYVVVSVVPEPATTLLLLLGLAGVGRARRSTT